MAKYSEELVERVIFLIEEEFYTTTQVCKGLGISRQAYYNWMDTKPEFKKEVDLAISRRSEAMLAAVQTALKKKLEGYVTTIEKDIYVPDSNNPEELIFKSKVITKKECPPDLRTIKMLLEREDKKTNTDIARPTQKSEADYVRDTGITVVDISTNNEDKEILGDDEVTEVLHEPESGRLAEKNIEMITNTKIINNQRSICNRRTRKKKRRR